MRVCVRTLKQTHTVDLSGSLHQRSPVAGALVHAMVRFTTGRTLADAAVGLVVSCPAVTAPGLAGGHLQKSKKKECGQMVKRGDGEERGGRGGGEEGVGRRCRGGS